MKRGLSSIIFSCLDRDMLKLSIQLLLDFPELEYLRSFTIIVVLD